MLTTLLTAIIMMPIWIIMALTTVGLEEALRVPWFIIKNLILNQLGH